MLIVISIMLSGVAVGYIFRRKKFKFISSAIMFFIFLLLFFLGISVGSNPEIMDNLSTIGSDALIITLGAVGGSCLAALAVYKFFFKEMKHEG